MPKLSELMHERVHPVYRGTAVAYHLLHITQGSPAMRELAHAALAGAPRNKPIATRHGDADTPTWERIGAYATSRAHPQADRYNWGTAAKRSALDKQLHEHLVSRHGAERVDTAVLAAHERLARDPSRLQAAMQRLHRDLTGSTRAAGAERVRELHHAVLRLAAYATDRATLNDRTAARGRPYAYHTVYAGDTTAARRASGIDGRQRDPLKLYRGPHTAPTPDGGSSAPMDELTPLFPDDIYSSDAARLYGHHGGAHPMDAATVRLIHAARGKPNAAVTVYRAVPKDVTGGINPGDWVTPNAEYAKQHGEGVLGGEYKVLKRRVKASELYNNGDSIHEWGWHPVTRLARSQRSSLASALAGLRGRNFSQLTRAVQTLLRAARERGSVKPVVAHHPEIGFHPATVLEMSSDNPELTRYLAAWHGLLTRHPRLVHFTVAEDGPDAVHTIRVPHPPATLASHLARVGVTVWNISPGAGHSTATVFDAGHKFDFSKLTETLSGSSNHTRGHGERISSRAATNDHATHRAAYRAAIRAAEGSGNPSGAGATRLSRMGYSQSQIGNTTVHHEFEYGDATSQLLGNYSAYDKYHLELLQAAARHGNPTTVTYSFRVGEDRKQGRYSRSGAQAADLGTARAVFRAAHEKMVGVIKRRKPLALTWTSTSDGDAKRDRLYHYLASRMARPKGYTLFHKPGDPARQTEGRYVLAAEPVAAVMRKAAQEYDPVAAERHARAYAEIRGYGPNAFLRDLLVTRSAGHHKSDYLASAASLYGRSLQSMRKGGAPLVEVPEPAEPRAKLSRVSIKHATVNGPANRVFEAYMGAALPEHLAHNLDALSYSFHRELPGGDSYQSRGMPQHQPASPGDARASFREAYARMRQLHATHKPAILHWSTVDDETDPQRAKLYRYLAERMPRPDGHTIFSATHNDTTHYFLADPRATDALHVMADEDARWEAYEQDAEAATHPLWRTLREVSHYPTRTRLARNGHTESTQRRRGGRRQALRTRRAVHDGAACSGS